MFLEFARDSKVYLVDGSFMDRLHVTEVEFSQSFRDKNYETRTLHNLSEMHEGSSITTANPAQFSLTIPMIRNSVGLPAYQHKLITFGIDLENNQLKTFDLYVETLSEGYKANKLTSCVVTGVNFRISRSGFLIAEISGEATKLERVGAPLKDAVFGDGTNNNVITSAQRNSLNSGPTAGQAEWEDGHDKFVVCRNVTVQVGGNTLDFVFGVNLEIQNEGKWMKHETLQDSLSVTNASNTMYPSTYNLNGRTVAGSIQQYVNTSTATGAVNLQTWSGNSTVNIKAGLDDTFDLEANLTPVSFTNRMNASEIYSQNYDFRLLSGAGTLTNLITYT